MREKTFLKWLLKMDKELELILQSKELDRKLQKRLDNVQCAYTQAVNTCIETSNLTKEEKEIIILGNK